MSIIGSNTGATVGGAPPSVDPTQVYFKYTYQSTLYDTTNSTTRNSTAPASGFIRANNADTAIATEFAIANLTTESQGIGAYILRQQVGGEIHIRGTAAQKFGIYKAEVAIGSGSGHKYVTVTPINGLALTNGDTVTLSFTTNANCIGNTTTGEILVNGVAVGNTLAVDTIADALSTVTVNAANHHKEFIVKDPGGNAANTFLEPMSWNLYVDNTAGKLRQVGAPLEFAANKGLARYLQPAANASDRVTDASIAADRTKATLTAHGLTTGVPAVATYLISKTTVGGWTADERVKVLNVSDANSVILDKAFTSLTAGNPVFYLITENMPIVKILNPILRGHSRLLYQFGLQFPNTASTKTVIGSLGAVQYWAPAAYALNRSAFRTVLIKNLGSVSSQVGTNIANTDTANDGKVTGIAATSSENTGAATTFTVTAALSAAVDYIEVTIVTAAASW